MAVAKGRRFEPVQGCDSPSTPLLKSAAIITNTMADVNGFALDIRPIW